MSDLKTIFQEMDSSLKRNPNLVDGVQATYQFHIDGEDYRLVFDGENSFAESGSDDQADCTILMNTEDFVKMVEGNLNGTQAFMSGRLKIKGNMGLALKLQDILKTYNQSA